MWWEKAYQQFDQALSGVQFEIKGLVASRIRGNYKRPEVILDDSDFLLTPNQVNGFFVLTRLSATSVQQYGTCAEARDLEDARCFEDRHCVAGTVGGQSIISPTRELPLDWVADVDADAHGIFTGRCNKSSETCEIYGWCPVQEDLDTLHAGSFKRKYANGTPISETEFDVIEPLYGVLNLTISIRNVIEFPQFNVVRRNTLPWMTEQYLRNCLYHPIHKEDRYCPNFRVQDVLLFAGANSYRILRHGGVIAITIDWKCDLDMSLDRCRPRYGFMHLDGHDSAQYDELGPGEGWMINLATQMGDVENIPSDQEGKRRLLFRVNGIHFLIRVNGEAGKFNLFIFTMNFGSNLALLSLATIVCDFILFHCTKQRKLFMEATHNVFLESKAGLIYTPRIILDSFSRKTDPKQESIQL